MRSGSGKLCRRHLKSEQGCDKGVLSPILFSLYIDEITTRLRQRGMGVTWE